MVNLTVHLHDEIKKQAFQKVKHDGVTFTFIINQMLQAYLKDKSNFRLFRKKIMTKIKLRLLLMFQPNKAGMHV